MADDGPKISVAAGITVGLVASFVQSFGLTIQRKSHLQNDALPLDSRKSDWHRPLWLVGFAIYFTSNVLGSIFQIGALPLVILGPLGAVSLLWNALLARFLLGDLFSYHLVFGTIFIAGGAVLIGYFGVVPEPAHPLEYLLKLYSRPAFIAEFVLLCAAVAAVCLTAHIWEWRLEKRLRAMMGQQRDEEIDGASKGEEAEPGFPQPTRRQRRISSGRRRRPRALSLPTPGQLSVGCQPPSPITPPALAFTPVSDSSEPPQSAASNPALVAPTAGVPTLVAPEKPSLPPNTTSSVGKIRLILGAAYGAASGTLSGVCLLFAKTGVELLILTVVGAKNEFVFWQTWVIIGALLVAAVLQLWYLNKALRLVGPTLICPLAFCFYSLSSILNGLVYYDQVKLLSGLQIGMVVLGTAVLLAGVWIVSIRSGSAEPADDNGEAVDNETTLETTPLLRDSVGHVSFSDEPEEFGPSDGDLGSGSVVDREEDEEAKERSRQSDFKRTIEQVYRMFVDEENQGVRGLSIGLGAASPGFAIRPSGTRDPVHRRAKSISSPAERVALARFPKSSTQPADLAVSLPALPVTSPPSSPDMPKKTLGSAPTRRPTQGDRTASAPGPNETLSDPMESTSSLNGTTQGSKSPTSSRQRPSRRDRSQKPRLSLSGHPYVGLESAKRVRSGEWIYDEPRTPLVPERADEESLLVRATSPEAHITSSSSLHSVEEDEEGGAREVGMVRAEGAGRFDWGRLIGRGRRKGKGVDI